MKKSFMGLMALAVFLSVLGMQGGQAKAEGYITYEGAQYVARTGIVFTFDAEVRTRDLKNATIYLGSDFYDLYCWVRKAEGKILCVAVGGTITGAHGVGVEKIERMCVQFDAASLAQFRAVRRAFDPDGLLNPDKAVPTLARCAEFNSMHVHHGELPHPELERF